MKRSVDAFGELLYAVHSGKSVVEVVERDDGHIGASPNSQRYFDELKRWPQHERRVMRFVGRNVLDVGCGAGRWMLELQKRGRQVVGIDTSDPDPVFDSSISMVRLSPRDTIRAGPPDTRHRLAGRADVSK